MPNSIPDPSPLATEQIRELLGVAWTSRRNNAQETLRLARQVLGQPLANAELARATLCLGCGLLQHGEFGLAEPELRRALHLYDELNDTEGQLDTLNILGIVKARQGRPVEALELFLQYKHLSVNLGDVEGEIRALLNIGAAYSSMGDHPNAVQHHLLVLSLSQQHGLPSLERRALNNLSLSSNSMGQHDDALKAALTCLELRDDNEPEPMLYALAFRNAGYAHFKLQQLSPARAKYLQSRALLEQTGDQAEIAGVDLLLGRVAQQQGRLDDARLLFQQSLESCQKLGDELGQSEGLLRLGQLLGTAGDVAGALKALHRARNLAQQGQLRKELCEVDLALSALYEQAGQPQEALTHLKQHLQLNGELFSAASDQRLQSLRVQFDLEQAERERLAAQKRSAELSELNVRLEESNRDLRAAQSQTADLLSRLEQHANEDALTSLPNRRAFDAALSKVLPEQQVSVVLCDIDRFKAVNDRFSHLVGDEVLRQVATVLRGQVRPGDLLARYGGEEFVLLMTEASSAITLGVCERLRQAIEHHDWSTVHPELQLTISVGTGVARLSPAELCVQDVVRAADDALYAAKNAGRNRVELRLLEA